jgi:EcoRII C terminal
MAREATDDVDPVEDPDGALLAWLEREEALFRQLERHLVLERIRQGFGDDVEGFIKFSLSVQNRRKSRVGFALEHHTKAILRANGIMFSFDKATEGDAKPDFLFPSVAHYHDRDFQADSLRMLAVKSTCKDRWRQVLAEADRILQKHLLTLEPSISRSQTEQMTSKGVSLVIPTELQQTYSVDQRRGLISLKTFIRELKVLQAALPPSALG